jgi:hypothetical protein
LRINDGAGRDDRTFDDSRNLANEGKSANLSADIPNRNMRWLRRALSVTSTPLASSHNASSTVVADARILAPVDLARATSSVLGNPK